MNWVEYNFVCFFYFRTTSVSGELGGVQRCLFFFSVLEPRVCPVNWVEYNVVCCFMF